MIVKVVRSEWRRGSGDEGNSLAHFADDKLVGRCCLGFACQQMGGYTDEQMRGKFWPHTLYRGLSEEERVKFSGDLKTAYVDDAGGLLTANTPFAKAAGRINDDPIITDDSRERALIHLFSAYGHVLHFVD